MNALGRIQGTLETHVVPLLEKHDTKIEELESFKDRLIGKQTVIGTLAGGVLGFIGSMVQTGFFHK